MSTQRLCVSPLLGSSLNDSLTLGYNKASMLAAIINAGRPELALELGIDPSSIGRCPPLELAQAITALREAEVELKSKSAKGHILDDDLAPFRVASEHAMATILNLLSALSPACFTKRIYDDLAAILGACSPASAAGAGASPGSLNELAEQSSWVHGIDFQYQALNVLVKDGDGLWLNLTQLDPTAVITCGRESVSMAGSYGNLGPFHYIEGQVCVSLSRDGIIWTMQRSGAGGSGAVSAVAGVLNNETSWVSNRYTDGLIGHRMTGFERRAVMIIKIPIYATSSACSISKAPDRGGAETATVSPKATQLLAVARAWIDPRDDIGNWARDTIAAHEGGARYRLRDSLYPTALRTPASLAMARDILQHGQDGSEWDFVRKACIPILNDPTD